MFQPTDIYGMEGNEKQINRQFRESRAQLKCFELAENYKSTTLSLLPIPILLLF